MTILRKAFAEFRADQASIVASGVAFRVALAIFPGIALLMWLSGRLLGEQEARGILHVTAGILPESTQSIVEQAVKSKLASDPASQGGASLLGAAAPYLGLAFMVWSTNGGMKALFNALNVIYDKEERRSFLRFTTITLVATLATLLAALLVTALVVVMPLARQRIGPGQAIGLAINLAKWPLLFAVLALALAILFRYGPNRERETWPLVTVGSVLGSLTLLLASALFSWFVEHFATLAVTYGSLSTVVAFMLWLWISFAFVLACAELDAAIERETGLYGTPKEREK